MKSIPTAPEAVLKSLELERWGVKVGDARVFHNLNHGQIRAIMKDRKEAVAIDNGTMVVDTGEKYLFTSCPSDWPDIRARTLWIDP